MEQAPSYPHSLHLLGTYASTAFPQLFLYITITLIRMSAVNIPNKPNPGLESLTTDD